MSWKLAGLLPPISGAGNFIYSGAVMRGSCWRPILDAHAVGGDLNVSMWVVFGHSTMKDFAADVISSVRLHPLHRKTSRWRLEDMAGTRTRTPDLWNTTPARYHSSTASPNHWSLMNIRKRLGDGTETWGTPKLINLREEEWPFTTATMKRSETKL